MAKRAVWYYKEERGPARVCELMQDSSLLSFGGEFLILLEHWFCHRLFTPPFHPVEIFIWYINPLLMFGSFIFNPVVLNWTGKEMMSLITLLENRQRPERGETLSISSLGGYINA